MKCPICKIDGKTELQSVWSYYSSLKYKIKKCNKCSLLYTDQNKDLVEKKNFYKQIYDYSVHESTKGEKLWRIKNTFSKVSELVKINNNSKVLDIGCMHGFFLSFLKQKYNCKTIGLETEDYYLKKKDKHINIIKSDLFKFTSMKKNLNQFDVIIMSHTFEHFPEPLKVLNCIKKLLKKDGKCLIIVPNVESRLSTLSKSFWGWLQPTAHFFHYSKKSLTKIFNNANFKYKLVSENGGDSLLLALTIINIVKKNFKKVEKSKYENLRHYFVKIFSAIFRFVYYFGNDEIIYLIEKK